MNDQEFRERVLGWMERTEARSENMEKWMERTEKWMERTEKWMDETDLWKNRTTEQLGLIRGKIEGKHEESATRLSKIAVAAAIGSALIAMAALVIGLL